MGYYSYLIGCLCKTPFVIMHILKCYLNGKRISSLAAIKRTKIRMTLVAANTFVCSCFLSSKMCAYPENYSNFIQIHRSGFISVSFGSCKASHNVKIQHFTSLFMAFRINLVLFIALTYN